MVWLDDHMSADGVSEGEFKTVRENGTSRVVTRHSSTKDLISQNSRRSKVQNSQVDNFGQSS